MLNDYASVGGIEVWNTSRLQAYLTNIGSPFTTGPEICSCDSLTPAVLGETFPAYQTPALDPAPWYDVDTPHSAEYLGFLPLSVAGVDDNPRGRSVSNAVGGGGVFGPVRELPRTITVTGVIVASTCCGAEYGLHFLSEVLSGCTGNACDGDCFEMYSCCPDPGMTADQFNADYRRTFRRTALVSGPTVVRRQGNGNCSSGGCSAGGDLITVEFVLTAATPWAWTDTTELLEVDIPRTPYFDIPCIEWCVLDPETLTGDCDPNECLFADCDQGDACLDPFHAIPPPPQPTVPLTSFCVPLGSDQACYEVDLSDRPTWSGDAMMITVRAGSSIQRNIRIKIYAKPVGSLLGCAEIAEANRCSPVAEFVITYMPLASTLTLDGQVGKALLVCNDTCTLSTYVYGDDNGGPVRFPELGCATYCVCVESDPEYQGADDASITFGVSGRGL